MLDHAIPGFKPLGSAEPDDPGHSTVCSRDWEFPSSPSPSAETPGPDLCFLLRAGENTQPSMLTQHQCHPGDSWRTRSVTRDWDGHQSLDGNSECRRVLQHQSHAGMVWAFLLMALGRQWMGTGKCLVHKDKQDPRGGRFSLDGGIQKPEMCVALMPHAHELAGQIALHSPGSCHTLGWLGPV